MVSWPLLFLASAAVAATPASLLDEARLLVDTGACEGAIELLEQIADEHPTSAEAPRALFEAGRCHEAADRTDAARTSYERILADHRGTPLATDATFRLGLLDAAGDDHRGALRRFRGLRRGKAAQDELARAVLALQIGTSQAALGREGAAIREVVPALEVLDGLGDDPDTAAYRAQAHVVLGDLAADAMQGISMVTRNAGAQRDRLQQRAAAMELASGHYRAAVDDRAPYWSCAAGFKMGLLNENQFHGLTAAPAPRGLDPEQSTVFLQSLQDGSVKFLEAARQTYQDTLAFAARSGTSNEWTDAAVDRLENMDLSPLMERDGI